MVMKMTRFLSTVFSTFLLLFGISGQAYSVHADIIINKQVSIRPANMSDLSLTQFTENIGINDDHYLGDDPIIFKILVRNTGPETVRNIVVVDTIPNYLEAHRPTLFGWNPATRTVTYEIAFLHPDQTNDTMIPMKVIANNALPGAPQTYCVTNTARFTATESTGSDTSQFCIEKRPPANTAPAPTSVPRVTQVPQPTASPAAQTPRPSPTPTAGPTNVTQVPSTGPAANALVVGGQILTLITGIAIKRRVS